MAKIATLEDADKKAHEASQSSFMKFENDGDTAVLVFRMYDSHGNLCIDSKESVWNEKTSKSEDFDPKKHEGTKPQVTFTFNCFCISSGNINTSQQPVMAGRLISLKAKQYKLARTCMEKYGKSAGGTDKIAIQMQRQGKKGDTNTTYSFLPEEPKEISKYAGLEEAIKNSKFFDPEKDHEDKEVPATTGGGTTESTKTTNSTSPGIASGEATTGISQRLKVVPGDKLAVVEAFKTRFGISKIRDLKESDVAAALTYIDVLEGKTPPAAEPTGAVDPFE